MKEETREAAKKNIKKLTEKESKFVNEFKSFILKGSVLDLAVGVLIGSAFQGLVKSLTDNIISPILGCFSEVNFNQFTLNIWNLHLRYGAFLTDVINFIIMAFVVFLIVKFFNKLKDFGKKEEKKLKGTFSSSLDKLETYFLALNGKKKIDFIFDYPDDFDKTVNLTSDNENVVKIENGILYGIGVGTSTITATLTDGNTKNYQIQVTDLIVPPTLNKNKSYLPCERYTEDEAILLDKILESRVKEMGEGSRGGVLAAARFLTLEFPYTIGYFNENGRLNGHGYRPYIDGEGRYYHKGLYLSKSKYKSIVKSTKTGPKMWGCKLYDNFVNRYKANGFTCSGFVTWAMYNGGFETGDVGAGDYKQFNDDLSDLGLHKKITQEYMKSGNYKVGDFIARNGHAALIIGISDTTIYTAESLPPKLKVYTYERYKGIVNDPNLTYVIEMSDIYPNGDGITTDMW